MKVLCICAWGNVRSVAMAQFIKELNGKYKNHVKEGTLKYQAIAIGNCVTDVGTRKMLKGWADVVIDMRDYLPKDIWRDPRHPELKQKVKEIWKNLKL